MVNLYFNCLGTIGSGDTEMCRKEKGRLQKEGNGKKGSRKNDGRRQCL